MTRSNGHSDSDTLSPFRSSESVGHAIPATPRTASQWEEKFNHEEIKQYIADLEIPFDPRVIEWRVTNTTRNGSLRGQVIPYADQRAYTDRLNQLFTPAGWTRRYTVQTSANFQRNKDQKTVAKVFVTCELTIFGIGSHSATGEEWAENQNAGTIAEAQAFKRASCCFGLGRYLYYFVGTWVDLDEHKRPKRVPQLTGWATPDGWRQGLRPNAAKEPGSSSNPATAHAESSQASSITKEIEGMAELLGRGLYRGLLRDLARVWNPREIHDISLLQRVLEHMRSAERGRRRVEAALDKTGPETLVPILKTLGLSSLEHVDTLETLKRIVVELERAPDGF